MDKGVSTYIKICGIRSVEMAQQAANEGANAIGLVFYAPSPRAVTIAEAKAIVSALPSTVDTVALLVNADANTVKRIIDEVNPRILQFHGDEDAAFCAQFQKPYWKAIRVNATTDLLKLNVEFASASRLLLDADARGADTRKLYGGSGEVFDWSLIPVSLQSRIILSGGLNPANVEEAIRTVHPWGVDVSSGVESSKGVKNAALITDFIRAVRHSTKSTVSTK
jgi:phosphoribosylanthranilate isomerase